ncbi:MAG: SCO family protein [Burkholderiales bacterium]
MSIRSVVILTLAAALGACGAQDDAGRRFHATDITGVDWARGFELTDHAGTRRSLADFRGKVVLVFFGFTNCADNCPLALADMSVLVRRLGADGGRVQGIFITIDPERDTAERLAGYVTAFYPSFIGLRGSPEEIARTATEFKVFYRAYDKEGARDGDYRIEHTDSIFVFDPHGKVRLYVSARDRTIEKLVDDVRRLLGA